MTKYKRCDKCSPAVINGVYCHECGCPNFHKVYDKHEERWVMPQDDEDDFSYCTETFEKTAY